MAFLTADRYGRKGSILRGSWVIVVGTIFQTAANGSALLIVGRAVSGLGNGINTVAVPIWQAESFKSHNRGVSLSVVWLTHKLKMRLGTFNCTKRANSFRSSSQYLHGSCKQTGRTIVLCLEVADRLSRSIPANHPRRTPFPSRITSVAYATRSDGRSCRCAC